MNQMENLWPVLLNPGLLLLARLLGLAAAWRLKGRGCFPAAGWAWRGFFLLFLGGLVSLGTRVNSILMAYQVGKLAFPPAFLQTGLAGIGCTLLDGVGLLYLVGAFALGDGARGEEEARGEGGAPRGSLAAGLVHLGVLFSLAGALVTMALTVLQRDRNSHLACHARQAFGFQTGLILVDAAAALLLAAFYPFLVLQAVRLRLVAGLVAGLLALFHLAALAFALYAAWQGWRGKPYSYPLFTGRLEGWETRASLWR